MIFIYNQYYFMKEKDKKDESRNDRPEAYPRPTATDNQLKNQPEFIDQQPADFKDKSISDLPANENAERQSNDPEEDLYERGLA
jgi:hypothetical protein